MTWRNAAASLWLHATQRADELMVAGDMDGRRVLYVTAIVIIGIVVQLSRYEHISQPMRGIPIVIRIDRLTGESCVAVGPDEGLQGMAGIKGYELQFCE